MLGEIRGEVRFKEPLSFHTSLRIGGPADIFIVPQDVEDIRQALAVRRQGAAAGGRPRRRQQPPRPRPRHPRRRAQAGGLPRPRRVPRRGGGGRRGREPVRAHPRGGGAEPGRDRVPGRHPRHHRRRGGDERGHAGRRHRGLRLRRLLPPPRRHPRRVQARARAPSATARSPRRPARCSSARGCACTGGPTREIQQRHQAAAQAEEVHPAAGPGLGGLRVEEPARRDRRAGSSRRWASRASGSTAPRSRPSTPTSSSTAGAPPPPTSLALMELTRERVAGTTSASGSSPRSGSSASSLSPTADEPATGPCRRARTSVRRSHPFRCSARACSVVSPRGGSARVGTRGRQRVARQPGVARAARAPAASARAVARPRSCRRAVARGARGGRRRGRLAAHVAALRGHRGRGGAAPAGSRREEIVRRRPASSPGVNLFRLDPAAVVAGVEALPRVRRAEVIRALPEPGHRGGGRAPALHARPRGPAALDRRAGGARSGASRTRSRRRPPVISGLARRSSRRATAAAPARPRAGVPLHPDAAARRRAALAAADLRDRREPDRRPRALHGGRASRCGWARRTGKRASAAPRRACWPSSPPGASRSARSICASAIRSSSRPGEVRRRMARARVTPGHRRARRRHHQDLLRHRRADRRSGSLDIVGVGHAAPRGACARAWWSTSTPPWKPSSTPSPRPSRWPAWRSTSVLRRRSAAATSAGSTAGAWWRSPGKHREVSQADVDRAVDAARAVNLPPDREIIHVLTQTFMVDDQDGVREPVGMLGGAAEVEVHLVTGAATVGPERGAERQPRRAARCRTSCSSPWPPRRRCSPPTRRSSGSS